ncbi:MAG: hypothetical protein HLUCCA05_14670 [Roseibaca calidilacus]|uniref:Uncharacterized protein n=1 Tax=Roseibaca calidilacus TaxID=1666912 RepID=A0A0P7WFB6_9RHOB|nr:hypothetical protein [Roseibaca calidilacus]KPP88956.1 MAG: hypothetical protein HLUCCA05_14670 [Roseibaca calidilacus]CUX79348.1 hypothetical protein Ga0058931_0026 [Roseibaca calidilacus]
MQIKFPPLRRVLNLLPSCFMERAKGYPLRAATIGLAILALLHGPALVYAQAAPVSVIHNDNGGSLEERLEMIDQMRRAGQRVEIRGRCASACTMFLGLPNACVARTARLGFHGPSSQFYGISLAPREFEYWSRVMADHYPSAIRTWFMRTARFTTMDTITITGAEAIRLGARACA